MVACLPAEAFATANALKGRFLPLWTTLPETIERPLLYLLQKARDRLSNSPVRWQLKKACERALRDTHEFSAYAIVQSFVRASEFAATCNPRFLPGVCICTSRSRAPTAKRAALARYRVFFHLRQRRKCSAGNGRITRSRPRSSAPRSCPPGCRSRGGVRDRSAPDLLAKAFGSAPPRDPVTDTSVSGQRGGVT